MGRTQHCTSRSWRGSAPGFFRSFRRCPFFRPAHHRRCGVPRGCDETSASSMDVLQAEGAMRGAEKHGDEAGPVCLHVDDLRLLLSSISRSEIDTLPTDTAVKLPGCHRGKPAGRSVAASVGKKTTFTLIGARRAIRLAWSTAGPVGARADLFSSTSCTKRKTRCGGRPAHVLF